MASGWSKITQKSREIKTLISVGKKQDGLLSPENSPLSSVVTDAF